MLIRPEGRGVVDGGFKRFLKKISGGVTFIRDPRVIGFGCKVGSCIE